MAGKKKTYDDDDGRVIAKMNVDGMPWYLRDQKKTASSNSNVEDLTKDETRAIIWGAVKAGLLIAGIFLLGALLFILFCIYVWFQ